MSDFAGFLDEQPEGDEEVIAETPEVVENFQGITIRTSGGETRYVPTANPMTVSAAMLASGLIVNGVVNYFLNNAEIQVNDIVPVGQTLSAIGAVKGG